MNMISNAFSGTLKQMTALSIQKFSAFLLFIALAGVPHMVRAQETPDAGPIVVELFTATDCAGCVFADRMLYDVISDDRVIALSCYIKETSSSSQSTAANKGPMDPCIFRQWTYDAVKYGETTLKLPYFVVGGEEKITPNSLSYFDSIMNQYKGGRAVKAANISLRWKDKDTITANLPTITGVKNWNSASLWIIRYKDIMIQKVDTGVNAGRVLRFSNVIQDVRHIGKWHGQARSIDIDVAPPAGGADRGGFAIIAQEMMGAPMLGAGKLADYPMPNDKPATTQQ